ncbi:hypothetical protein DSS3PM1_00002 [Bacteriophage DSS3_PM1]|nr:hypothetical protein DSS3PM1_00002 [Bacteriophage DSS3_PM1]
MTRKNTKKSLEPSPLLGANEIGHWGFTKKFRVSEWFGFIYCITRKSDGKFYFGKKQLRVMGKKRSANYGKEHSWRTYTGSSDVLNKDIKALGKDAFNFEIVDLYKTKGGLYYAEAYLQMVSNSLPLRLPSDPEEFASYNATIAAVRFIPKEEPTYRTKTFVSKVNKRLKERSPK